MKRELTMTFFVVAACMFAGKACQAQTLSLDADYVGSAGWHSLGFPVFTFGAVGEDLTAPSGLTNAHLSSEGYVDIFGDLGFYPRPGMEGLGFWNPNGDEMWSAPTSGQGTVNHYSGTFKVAGGNGRFAGATGGGMFSIDAGPYVVNDLGAEIAPAILSIRGTVTAPAIPEPGSLALLAGPLTLAAGLGLRRRFTSA
jgi:hypothetical protein